MLSLICALSLIFSQKGVSQDQKLVLNDKEYFEKPGFSVMVFENEYNGFFFDEKTAGILMVHHGVRNVTGGAVRVNPTPEQWDQIPVLVERKVNREDNSIDVLLRYEDFDFDSWLNVRPDGNSIIISVKLDKALPEKLEGRAGLNIEFLPTSYFGKTYFADGKTGIFPLHPSDSMSVLLKKDQLRQFAGHSTANDRGRGEFLEPKAFARGKTLHLSPEDPETSMRIETLGSGDLMLLDGRAVAQNGWYVVRSLIPANKTGKVVEWRITPHIIPEWIREPVIGYSQVGYHPGQEKVAVMELDKNDQLLGSASILKLNEQGEWIEVYIGDVVEWGEFYRQNYARFDFSGVKDPGLYSIQYGEQKTGVFQIGADIHDHGWQATLDVWFPVQMDHMFVNEAYRVWHGMAHVDDAIQAPLNHQHFDGYFMGDTTETQYKPGERIPGLNIGGWFDAGDFDIRTGSHSNTVLSLVDTWEHFGILRDETLIDQEENYVDIHHPDGSPDLLQQIEHGTLALIAQHRAFGRAIPGIIVPELHQYHHLGDGSTMTDNLIYNPELKPYESDGYQSGTPDDRWAFTVRMARNSYASLAALAAASRALKDYNPELSKECLLAAEHAWVDEQSQEVKEDPMRSMYGASEEVRALLQLYLATKDDKYADDFKARIWSALESSPERHMMQAAKAVPYLDQDYKKKLETFVRKYKVSNDAIFDLNPYGVPITTRGWAGNSTIIEWAICNYHLNLSYPEIVGAEDVYRGLDYIYGCHPYSNISFVSGVGLYSKRVAYGSNRADYSFIAGGVVPGILVLKPDLPENMIDWPFLWGENEYVIDICAEYIFLVNAVNQLKAEPRRSQAYESEAE